MSEAQAQAYYASGEELVETVLAALAASGRPTAEIDSDDLAALDEFHGRGRSATIALLRLAQLRRDERVLDIGAGIGGPARTMVRHFGVAKVCALDPTARFCELSRELNRRCGLAERIEVVLGTASRVPFPDACFDIAVTQALWPSVEDKRSMLSEAHRVIVPGGCLAILEVVAGPKSGELLYPVPWADGPEQSHLITAAHARDLAEEAGFEPTEWLTGTDALAATLGPDEADDPYLAAGVEGVNLGLLMPEYETRMAAVGQNIAEGRIELLIAVFERP